MASSSMHAQLRPYETTTSIPNNSINLSELEEEQSVTFLHPCGPRGHCVLFCLPALDISSDLEDKPLWGLDHEIARIACGILAGNRWDGYFLSFSGQRVKNTTKLLAEERYFFILPDTSNKSRTSCTDCNNVTMEERGRTLTRRSNTATRSSSVRTSSTVTSAGARTPTSIEDNGGQYGQYSYHISSTAPTKEEAWENEEVWQKRQRQWRESV
ncbi:hypothetical protein F4679DRAFT_586685 [Xylaria curta]|nr:hypothetical protein F4679DRAFT_586685 [Xylaria curta]